MNKRFRVCSHDQPFLLPPSLQYWLPENHLARFIAEVMNELNLSSIYASYERSDGRGLAAYHPVLMARLLLYGQCIGITSSRKIEQATYDNVAFRYLSADQHPGHDTVVAFCQQNVEALAELFVQALRLWQKAGLVKLGNVSIDGTKMKANASTRRSVRFERISEREQHWRVEIARLLSLAQQTDRQEEKQLGSDSAANRLPDELANAQKRFERLQQAKAEKRVASADFAYEVCATWHRSGSLSVPRIVFSNYFVIESLWLTPNSHRHISTDSGSRLQLTRLQRQFARHPENASR